MSGRPWLKWYPSDWRADPGLRMCSLTARGLWIEILGLMHEAQPVGHLLVNGRAPTATQLGVLVGSDAATVTAALDELEAAGVFSLTADGVIWSRRMVRDAEKSEEGREWVKKRWPSDDREPPPGRDTAKGKTRQPTRDPNRGPNRSPTATPNTQKPESRVQSLDSARDSRTPRENAPSSDMPALDDPPHCWLHMGDKWEVDGEMVRRAVVAGEYLDLAARRVCEAARTTDPRWRGDWGTLVAWLKDGLDLDTVILPAIKRVVSRPAFRGASTLRYFDPAVRERMAA